MVKENNDETTRQRDLLIAWLNDAYAMEQGLVPVLENHSKDASAHPEVAQRIRQHMEETQRHAELVQGCVERLGSSTSAVKTATHKVMGQFKAISTGMLSDELVKNNLGDIAVEHFEIACYRSLITAAQAAGDEETVAVCEEIIEDEQAMADWLEEQLPTTTTQIMREYASAGSSGVTGGTGGV